jgi:hypothetical protein
MGALRVQRGGRELGLELKKRQGERGGEREGRGGRRPCHWWPAGIAGGGSRKRQSKRGRRGAGINFPLIAI